jgi:hypothetical protein
LAKHLSKRLTLPEDLQLRFLESVVQSHSLRRIDKTELLDILEELLHVEVVFQVPPSLLSLITHLLVLDERVRLPGIMKDSYLLFTSSTY